jgi:hypothetical protein
MGLQLAGALRVPMRVHTPAAAGKREREVPQQVHVRRTAAQQKPGTRA